ncbi:MAG TPA: hypothetical protein VHD82_22465 [Amycolatopsis sp.]|nr:hypothetical protein [Amycolatopsis sp.]HVV12017.1 hypothetical protein [Amycolatopsis sp.]
MTRTATALVDASITGWAVTYRPARVITVRPNTSTVAASVPNSVRIVTRARASNDSAVVRVTARRAATSGTDSP